LNKSSILLKQIKVKRRIIMKYELKRSGENYIKVYPYETNFYKYSNMDLETVKREIERHVDDINSVEITNEYNYTFKDEYTNYECKSLKELCEEMAYQRDLIELNDYWEVTWVYNNETHRAYVNDFEELLDCVADHKGISIVGDLTKEEEILVDMAKLLQD
jgi:hypothetical protein